MNTMTITNNNILTNNEGTAMTTNTISNNATTISSSAVLFDLSIKVFSATVTDAEVADGVAADNNASHKAGTYLKNLLAECKELDTIKKFAAMVRTWNKNLTMPWNDNGLRLLPMSLMLDHKAQLTEFERQYWDMVDAFLCDYGNHVAAAAFTLGKMFDRSNYPCVTEVRNKFAFNKMYSPVPTAGHWMVDTNNAGLAEVVEHSMHEAHSREARAMQNVWDRMYKIVSHMADKLKESNFDGSRPDGKKTKLHDSMLSNAEDFVGLLDDLNVGKDPRLSEMGNDLRRLLAVTDLGDLKKDAGARVAAKAKLDDILNKFNL